MKLIWCIVPFSKPDCKEQVLNNFARQEYPNKKLCVVENGRGIGSFDKHECDLLLSSENHQSKAKNVALDTLRKEYAFATFDCDDYYGPAYLDEISSALKTRKLVGKHKHWINIDDGKLHLIDEEGANKETNWIHGATLSAHLNIGARFPIVRLDEESGFVRAAKVEKLITLSMHHYVYSRGRGDHTYPISIDGFLATAGKRKEFEYDLDVVNNKKKGKLIRVIDDPIADINKGTE